jgi:Lon protease-like protein
MARGRFDPTFEELPATLPIFPLTGVLLLPSGRLPLNIFEPRYLAMTRAALAGDRMIGMIQPTEPERPDHPPALFGVGCAGRIIAFSETDDGRYLITLGGLVRFGIKRELEPDPGGFRRVEPDFARFAADMVEDDTPELDRPRFMRALKGFFQRQGISGDWEAIEKTSDRLLVISLAMVCPFQPEEKQALLEAPSAAERARILTALLEMSVLASAEATARH